MVSSHAASIISSIAFVLLFRSNDCFCFYLSNALLYNNILQCSPSLVSTTLGTDACLWSSLCLDKTRHIRRGIECILVKAAWIENGSRVGCDCPCTGSVRVARCQQQCPSILCQWIFDALEIHVLNSCVCLAPRVVSIRGGIFDVVVVQVCILQVVSRRIALVDIVEKVVVNSCLCNQVFCPSNTKCFIMVSKNVVGNCKEVCVLAAINQAVACLLQQAVVDPNI